MNSATTWLVGTEEDRRRIRETERVVTGARQATIITIIATLPFIAAGRGWWILPVGVAYVAYSKLVDRKYRTSDYADVWMMSLTLTTQTMFAGVAIATGGPNSAAALWMVIVMVLLPCRYGRNGIIVGAVWSLVWLAIASLSQGWAEFAAHPEIFAIVASTGGSCLAYGIALRRSEVQLRRDVVLDPLTGLLNRSRLDERFEEVRQIAVARDRTVGLLVCDLDHFKAVNDHHGHVKGDAVLVATAYELRRVLRDFELIYRLGGEEFAVVLPDTDLDGASAHAELVRAAILAAKPGGVTVTVSVGVAIGDPGELDFTSLFAAADAALYRAKHAGRNRVVAGVLGDANLREIQSADEDDDVAAAA